MDEAPILDQVEFVASLPDDLRQHMQDSAQVRRLNPGEVLIYRGDAAEILYVLLEGQISIVGEDQGAAPLHPGALIDPAAVLGGQPHGVRAAALSACRLLMWPLDMLNDLAGFREASRLHLGKLLRQAETRLAGVSATIPYGAGAAISPGPFVFSAASIVFAFCEAARDPVQALLPDGLSLLRLPGGERAPLLIALADFPHAAPQDDDSARFAYNETTVFIPVRFEAAPGVFIPYIYPSSWQAILIGREVYGFPKQHGETSFGAQDAALRVDDVPTLHLVWEDTQASGEARLVGALMRWLGIQRHLSAAAFSVGDSVRRVAGLPPYRRIDVYAHKRIPAAASQPDAPLYDVDHLTHAVFGVLRWHSIHRLQSSRLTIHSGPLASLDVTLREAFRTRLDMRLSTGRVVGSG